jgi:uncharacterized membrane protein YdfJ with MMPL/SSD domain
MINAMHLQVVRFRFSAIAACLVGVLIMFFSVTTMLVTPLDPTEKEEFAISKSMEKENKSQKQEADNPGKDIPYLSIFAVVFHSGKDQWPGIQYDSLLGRANVVELPPPIG